MVARIFLFSWFGVWLFAAGCAWDETAFETPPTPPPVKFVYPFMDIPFPGGFERDQSKSFVYESGNGNIKVGRIFYSGWSPLSEVVKFYQNEMVNKGWSMVSATEHKSIILNYEKEGWVCTLVIHSAIGKTYIEIHAGPS